MQGWRELEAEAGRRSCTSPGRSTSATTTSWTPWRPPTGPAACATSGWRPARQPTLARAGRFDGPVLHQPDGGWVRADVALDALLDGAVAAGRCPALRHPVVAVELAGTASGSSPPTAASPHPWWWWPPAPGLRPAHRAGPAAPAHGDGRARRLLRAAAGRSLAVLHPPRRAAPVRAPADRTHQGGRAPAVPVVDPDAPLDSGPRPGRLRRRRALLPGVDPPVDAVTASTPRARRRLRPRPRRPGGRGLGPGWSRLQVRTGHRSPPRRPGYPPGPTVDGRPAPVRPGPGADVGPGRSGAR